MQMLVGKFQKIWTSNTENMTNHIFEKLQKIKLFMQKKRHNDVMCESPDHKVIA